MVSRPAWLEPDGNGTQAATGPESIAHRQHHANKFRHSVYQGEPVKVYGEQRFHVILTDLCREEGSVTGGSVRRPLQCSREIEETLKTR